MREAISRILRVGLVNSGMFDTLVINTDVRAVHLVGDNNVGKTSLIELIQFLYFPNVQEMRFSKSTPETLSFYFRPEGSYILFDVRTVRGTQRTLGIYGTGTADSRQVFVFNGGFDLVDFLDDQRRVISLQRVSQRLLSQHIHIYTRVEDHERALVGEHSEDRANMHLFDLPRNNFRLLRKLLQNLLRLERLTSRDIRLFLNALVESAGQKIRIDIARDFDRKYGDIKAIRERIAALNRLKPLIEEWVTTRQRLERARQDEQNARLRLGHTAQRYAAALALEQQALTGQLAALRGEQQQLNSEQQQLSNNLAEVKSRLRGVEQVREEYARLTKLCTGRQEADVQAERDQLTHQAMTLQEIIGRIAASSMDQVTRRLERLRSERDQLRRRLEQRTVEHLFADTDLDEETRALLRFLLAENVLSLSANGAVSDEHVLVATARAAATMLDTDSVFRGFGLVIPRAEWYRPQAYEQSVVERLADTEQRIREAESELTVARDRADAQQRLNGIRQRAVQLDRVWQSFQRLRELEEREGDERQLSARITEHNRHIEELQARQQSLGARSQALQEAQVSVRTELATYEQTQHDVTSVLREIASVAGDCPDDIAHLDAADLPEYFALARSEYTRRRSAVQPALHLFNDAQARLAHVHEREAPDVGFDTWVAEKHLLTGEVERLEGQLRESYENLLTVVKGELDKLTQAFEAVRSRVAELNTTIRRVSISNIERIELHVQESDLVEAIRQTSRIQLDLFSPVHGDMSLEEAERQIEAFVVGTLRAHGRELNLDDLFQLEFRVTFTKTGEQRTVEEIHAFESNGTAIGVKIVVYLGLIKLLQVSRQGIIARIPFFLDEVGSLSSNNVRQIIAYCDEHNFLPIFASPTIRDDISHSYVLRRFGERSHLVNEVILTEGESINVTTSMDSAART